MNKNPYITHVCDSCGWVGELTSGIEQDKTTTWDTLKCELLNDWVVVIYREVVPSDEKMYVLYNVCPIHKNASCLQPIKKVQCPKCGEKL